MFSFVRILNKFHFIGLEKQLINHGVSEKLTHNVIDVGKEFFVLPAKDKASLYSEDPKQKL